MARIAIHGRKAAETAPLKGILGVLEEEWTSSRIVGDPHSSIVDLPLTVVQEGTLLSVVAWSALGKLIISQAAIAAARSKEARC